MTQEEMWLLNEKYNGEKTEVLELLRDFIAFQSRPKFEEKPMMTSEVNTHSLSESELVFTEFWATTMQNEKTKTLLETHGEILKKFHADCNRLAYGEPVAYVIGHIPFLNTTIYLDGRPLIPRTETEFWVEKMIAHIKKRGPAPLRVLDLCAGSGCIGIAVLKHVPNATVDFAEIDETLHATIEKNIHENDIDPSRTHIYSGSLFTKIDEMYDYILTNPPYIDRDHNQTAESVKQHEPALALYAENKGFALIKSIISEARTHLTPHGVLAIEHDPEQSHAIHTEAEKHGFIAETKSDQFEVLRYTMLTMQS